MKIVKIISIILFFVIVVTPLCFFNTQTNSVSVIDNRRLTENPFSIEGDLTENIQNYINDRIGFRDEIITAYTVLNDKVFGKMVHPSYKYGKDGYVFGAGLTTVNNFGDFHIAFADMVAEIQAYCDERNVPFLFVFNPAKPAVYQDKIADGVNYNREWVDLFFAELEKRNINYLDNTEIFVQLRENGVEGFNQKYDANHWNDLGAFYGTQAMLKELSRVCDAIHINELEEFSVSEQQQTSLLVSKFPINEYVPAHDLKVPTINLYDDYFAELDIHQQFRGFGYWVNSSDGVKNTPKTLVFQGSYMNGHGQKYMINAFQEYIFVHDYQNVLNFPYYFNIFQPECVIFEVAEYTLNSGYFDYEQMKNLDYSPSISKMQKDEYALVDIEHEDIVIEKGNTLTKITWNTDQVYPYLWACLDDTYDMQKVEGGYQTTIETERYESSENSLKIYRAVS